MASRQPERFIPHVLDVFRHPAYAATSSSGSGPNPIADRRSAHLDSPTDETIDYPPYDGAANNNRLSRAKRRPVDDSTNTSAAEPRYDRGYPSYSHQARTLTEKDLKHIERHLSMKKTIRKQLSRHLSQAFVESNDGGAITAPPVDPHARSNHNRHGERPQPPVTSSQQQQQRHRAEVANSNARYSSAVMAPDNCNYQLAVGQSRAARTTESNFLALLKEGQGKTYVDEIGAEEDDDSGHCSPTAELDLVLSQWVEPKQTRAKDQWLVKETADRSVVTAAPSSSGGDAPKKSSFWKKLTIRAKTKR